MGLFGRDIESRDEKETGRIEAFSDAVFSIAATLLVLEIRVPLMGNGEEYESATELVGALVNQWPSYFGYFLGFATIVVMWINHHHLFSMIRKNSHALLLWNSLLLLIIAVVPFPTALVADYMRNIDSEVEKVAAVIYCGVGFLIALSFNFLWWYVSKGNRLLDPTSDPKDVQTITRSYYYGPVLYFTAMLVSFYNATVGLMICALIVIFFSLSPRTLGKKFAA